MPYVPPTVGGGQLYVLLYVPPLGGRSGVVPYVPPAGDRTGVVPYVPLTTGGRAYPPTGDAAGSDTNLESEEGWV